MKSSVMIFQERLLIDTFFSSLYKEHQMSFLASLSLSACVLASSSFRTISPAFVCSALFIIYHFLSIWPLKFTSDRKSAFVHYYCEILIIKSKLNTSKYNGTCLVSQGGGRNGEIKWH